MKILLLIVALFGCSMLTGCEDASDKDSAKTPVTYAPATDVDKSGAKSGEASKAGRVGPFDKKFEGITFSVPAGWREVDLAPEQQGFVDAKFLVPSKGTDLQLTFLSAKGGIDLNVERWTGQFQMPAGEKPQSDSLKVGNADARWVELHGTFNSGMMSRERPRENWRMIGVGIPMGDHDFYLKLTGPEEAVAAVREEFRQFVKSARVNP